MIDRIEGRGRGNFDFWRRQRNRWVRSRTLKSRSRGGWRLYGGRWAARHLLLLERFRVQSNSLAFSRKEFRSRGRKEYIPLRSDQVDIRHSNSVNQIAIYYQSNLHRVVGEGDHVWKGTGCRKEQHPYHIDKHYLNNEILYACVCVQIMTEYFIQMYRIKFVKLSHLRLSAPNSSWSRTRSAQRSLPSVFESDMYLKRKKKSNIDKSTYYKILPRLVFKSKHFKI